MAKSNICEVLGNEYPLLIDGNNLTDYLESRVEQGVSLGELDIEAALLKIIFQWGVMPQPHRANKVQSAYEQVMRCNVHQLQSEDEPYLHQPDDAASVAQEDAAKDSLVDRILLLSQEGQSQRGIARLLNINQSTVSRTLKKRVTQSDARCNASDQKFIGT